MLTAVEPTAPYHPDILPSAGYTLAARQLLAGAVASFVFGGMGSWNDVVSHRSRTRTKVRNRPHAASSNKALNVKTGISGARPNPRWRGWRHAGPPAGPVRRRGSDSRRVRPAGDG